MKTMDGREKEYGAMNIIKRAIFALVLSIAALACWSVPASAQGSRKDDIVFGPTGHPIAGATVAVCQATATGSPCAPLATIYTDATLTLVSGVYVLNGFAGSGGQGAAIKIDAGALQNCHVFGGGLAVVSVIDGNGNPIGGCSVQSANAFDYVVGTSNVDRLRSDLFTAGDTNGPALRAAASGSRFASVAIDPATFAGSIALASGTATVTFPTAYTSAPVCTANDTSAIATVRVQTTATTLTLRQSSGTDTIMYVCVGNPN
jgi:hypothetical protein